MIFGLQCCCTTHARPSPENGLRTGRTGNLWASVLCSYAGLGVFPQVAAPGDRDEDEDDGDFVEVPEKEGYEACIPDHLRPEYGECSWGGRGPVKDADPWGVTSHLGSGAP